MRMDDPPGDVKPVSRTAFIVALAIVGVCTFVVAFYLAALAFLPA